ncbi:MAG: hypothetical protein QW324_02205 [Thermofilaceae archaeon]
MKGRGLGVIIMSASLCFGAIYIASFLKWLQTISVTFKGEAWSWWVIAFPILAIVVSAVFFFSWIGWVIASASEAKKAELLKPLNDVSQLSNGQTARGDRSPL